MRRTNSEPKRVADLMTDHIVTLGASDSVEDARDLILPLAIHSIPVIDDDGMPVGIVTSHDLVEEWSGSQKLSEVMSEGVVTIEDSASLVEAAEVMKSECIHHLLVVQGRQPVGILSTFDLLDALLWKPEVAAS